MCAPTLWGRRWRVTSAETGRSVHKSGIYTFNVNNSSLGDSTPTAYRSVLGFGRGTGGSTEIGAKWTYNGDQLYWRSLRDCTDNWWAWKEIWHAGSAIDYSGWTACSTIFNAANCNIVGVNLLQINDGGSAEGIRFTAGGNDCNLNRDDTDTGLYWSTPNGWMEIGPLNTSHCHFNTDRGSLYFYKTLYVPGLLTTSSGSGDIGSSSSYFNTIYMDNWYRSSGSTGWYNQTYGGGIHMQDSTWIRTYGGKWLLAEDLFQASDIFVCEDVAQSYSCRIDNNAGSYTEVTVRPSTHNQR